MGVARGAGEGRFQPKGPSPCTGNAEGSWNPLGALGLGRGPGSAHTQGMKAPTPSLGHCHRFPKRHGPASQGASPPSALTVTPEMMGDLPSMSLCTSWMASSLLLSLNLFLESSSSASLNCSNVMVRQDFPLQGERTQGRWPLTLLGWGPRDLLTLGAQPCLQTPPPLSHTRRQV